MDRKRTLSLKKETLAELAPGELRDVAGGGATRYTCFTICGICEVTGVLCPATIPSIDVICH